MGFFVALQFLTALPSPFGRDFDGARLARSQAYFPMVGALLGILLAALDAILRPLLSEQLSAALLLLALVLASGGIHLDGLIDTCDGIFLQRGQAERLSVMRDSRSGSFGVIGAVMVLLLKWTALLAIPAPARLAALVLSPAFSRWGMVFAIAAFPYARQEGKGSAFRGHGRGPLLFATLLAIMLAVALWPQRGPLLLAAVAVWVAVAGRFMAGRLGGLTGDTYGALNETAELLVLIGAGLVWPA